MCKPCFDCTLNSLLVGRGISTVFLNSLQGVGLGVVGMSKEWFYLIALYFNKLNIISLFLVCNQFLDIQMTKS